MNHTAFAEACKAALRDVHGSDPDLEPYIEYMDAGRLWYDTYATHCEQHNIAVPTWQTLQEDWHDWHERVMEPKQEQAGERWQSMLRLKLLAAFEQFYISELLHQEGPGYFERHFGGPIPTEEGLEQALRDAVQTLYLSLDIE